MPTLSTTYLIPAILLNPAFILHLINTFVSHMLPPPLTISRSPHPFMESIGPLPGAKPYLDMHADDQLCWSYTAIMVVLQVLAFGRVQDNRGARKIAKAAKIEERERLRREKLEKLEEERIQSSLKGINGHATGMDGTHETAANGSLLPILGSGTASRTTTKLDIDADAEASMDDLKLEAESEYSSSVTETSEEEMIV